MTSPAGVGDSEAQDNGPSTPVLSQSQNPLPSSTAAVPSSSQPTTIDQATSTAAPATTTTTATTANLPPPPTTNFITPQAAVPNLNPLPSHPATSHTDPGAAKRPRDARLIHLILASLGVSAYQERVPLQLLDFAYRYTSSVLSDAAHLQAEGWDHAGQGHESGGGGTGAGKSKGGRAGAGTAGTGAGTTGALGWGGVGAAEKEEVSLSSLRIAIGSRMQHQYQGTLPKEYLTSLAKERNRIGLAVGRGFNVVQQPQQPQQQPQDSNNTPGSSQQQQMQMIGGVKLPPEKYCLSGTGWGLREEWDSEGFEEDEDDIDTRQQGQVQENGVAMDGLQDERLGEDGEDGEATMEDIFGIDGDDTGGSADIGLVGEDQDMPDG